VGRQHKSRFHGKQALCSSDRIVGGLERVIYSIVMVGPVPTSHDFFAAGESGAPKKVVDARNECGHDGLV
jgi:hypothetical protein